MKKMAKLAAVAATLAVSGCMSATVVGEPPMIVRDGVAKTVAFVPVSSNETEVGTAFTEGLSECLQSRNVYKFVPAEKVAAYVEKKGYDIHKMFGLDKSSYADIAKHFNADYTFHGSVAVQKSLTLAGWRKDIDAFVRMNRAGDGEKLDHWRAMTGFTFTNTDTATDGKKMAKSAVNHICTKIVEGK